MARVHYVKSAAKDYPHAGVKKGEPYYWWKPFRQGKRISKERPKASQVATSEYAQRVLGLVEGLEEWGGPWTESDRDDLVLELEEIRDMQQDSYDAMPEGLQQGDVGVMLEERVSALDEWIDELGQIGFPEPKEGEEEGDEEEVEGALEQALASAPSI